MAQPQSHSSKRAKTDTGRHFKFSVDRGGTFTDIICEHAGGVTCMKLLSRDASYADAPTEGIRRILERETGIPFPRGSPVNTSAISSIRMGTTVATNALLERNGAEVALFVTRGFGDLLTIGNQSRPKIFDLNIRRPSPLHSRVYELDERIILHRSDSGDLFSSSPCSTAVGVTGERVIIETPINTSNDGDVATQLRRAYADGIRSISVLLLHSFIYPHHELAVEKLALEIGFTQISLSHKSANMVKAVPRGLTSVADAYLTPLIKTYLQSFRAGFDEGISNVDVLFMQSDGGLADVDDFTGSRAILSGPAGGVIGYALTAFDTSTRIPVVGFDMGGTSTDVSRYAGSFDHVTESVTAGVIIQAPQLDINTVAAGGGSRLLFHNGMLAVGPESAGSDPGPSCYRKGGPLAITDANLILGRLQPDFFPRIFGSNRDEALDAAAPMSLFQEMLREVTASSAGSESISNVYELALGFIRVANEAMCRPIREMTSARGFDIRSHVLSVFGGAGGQHACAIARTLGISKVFVHKYASVLSAYGLSGAELVEESQAPAAAILVKGGAEEVEQDSAKRVGEVLKEIASAAAARLSKRSRLGLDELVVTPYLNLRFQGTDFALMTPGASVAASSLESLTAFIPSYPSSFLQRYKTEFGFDLSKRDIIVDDIRVRVTTPTTLSCSLPPSVPLVSSVPLPAPRTVRDVHLGGKTPQSTPLYLLSDLPAGVLINGPALVIDELTTLVVEPDCRAYVCDGGHVTVAVDSLSSSSTLVQSSERVDPVLLSIFSHRFMSIAEQMGRTLQRTAISTNIKERLDFSCALFDAQGGLVANAPHIPVHLGSMQDAVRFQVTKWGSSLSPGDVLLSNHPQAGGTHLPDITIITPVFNTETSPPKPIFFVASRGHHADIGGSTPGSMPPQSTSLRDEGAASEGFKIVSGGVFNSAEVEQFLSDPGKHAGCSAARNQADNVSDLQAQIAANQKGISLVNELAKEFGVEIVQRYMGHIQAAAESAVRELLKDVAARCISSGGSSSSNFAVLEAVDYMDDGTPIRLQVTIDSNQGSAVFDFTGTGVQVLGNCNAPKAITYSAVLYCLRCMVTRDIPMNQGCLTPVTFIIPSRSILYPDGDAAVVGGNVLTSQRLCDVVLQAFEACACSQGCMNNFLFGDATFGYYETIAGGSGAGPVYDGTSGVHTHMTNTRITDPEILERRYPVILREFSLRSSSGGGGGSVSGGRVGGDGIIRRVQFRRDGITMSLLSERRSRAPAGLCGGGAGSPGVNVLRRSDGIEINIGAKARLPVSCGDTVSINTPGGGGYGSLRRLFKNAPPACADAQPPISGGSLQAYRDNQHSV